MLHPLPPPGRLESSSRGQFGDRQGVEVRLRFIEKLIRCRKLPGTPSHPDHPFAHWKEKAAITDRLVEKRIRRRNDGYDRLEVWRCISCREPLRLADVGSARHADIAIAPALRGQPLDRV